MATAHTNAPAATPVTLRRPRSWAWPPATLVGFPIGGLIGNLVVGPLFRRLESRERTT